MATLDTEILDEIVRRLVAEFRPEQIVLFGSRAWGNAEEDSDVDLLVIVSESNDPPTQRARRAYRCLGDIGVSTDVLVKTRTETERFRHVPASLEHKILEQGKVLHG